MAVSIQLGEKLQLPILLTMLLRVQRDMEIFRTLKLIQEVLQAIGMYWLKEIRRFTYIMEMEYKATFPFQQFFSIGIQK